MEKKWIDLKRATFTLKDLFRGFLFLKSKCVNLFTSENSSYGSRTSGFINLRVDIFKENELLFSADSEKGLLIGSEKFSDIGKVNFNIAKGYSVDFQTTLGKVSIEKKDGILALGIKQYDILLDNTIVGHIELKKKKELRLYYDNKLPEEFVLFFASRFHDRWKSTDVDL